MKTEKSTSENETLNDSINLATKWLNENTKMMADTFQKQMNRTFDLYTNFYSPVINSGKMAGVGQNYSEFYTRNGDLFFKNLKSFSEMSQEMMNTMLGSFSAYNKLSDSKKGPFDAVLETFENQVGQMIEYNKQLYTTLGKNFGTKQMDMGTFNEKFEEKMRNDFEASRNAMKKFLETYSTKTGFSLDSNKELIQDINKQIENVIESNRVFWKDIMNAFEGTAGEEKHEKEQSPEMKPVKIKEPMKMQTA